ncbi:MAG: hypothetical protein WC554_11585 [Clostridia bacterium]|jgi:hypothetical protein
MKRKSTLRKLPPKTREIARLLNELELVSKHLQKCLDEMAQLEKLGKAYEVIQRMKPDEIDKLQLWVDALPSPPIIVEVLGGVAEVISAIPVKYVKFDHDEDDAKPSYEEAIVDPSRVRETMGEIK